MRLKDLFTVPAGEKVTEKALRRVLVSSICSILLCMTCLVSTTWAWFTVSVENTGNVIEIANIKPVVEVKKVEAAADLDNDGTVAPNDKGSYVLDPGSYNIRVSLEQTANTAILQNDSRCPVYVAMTVEQGSESACYYLAFNNREVQLTRQMTVNSSPAIVSFSVSWVQPVNASAVGVEPVIIGAGEPAAEPSADETTAPEETNG